MTSSGIEAGDIFKGYNESYCVVVCVNTIKTRQDTHRSVVYQAVSDTDVPFYSWMDYESFEHKFSNTLMDPKDVPDKILLRLKCSCANSGYTSEAVA